MSDRKRKDLSKSAEDAMFYNPVASAQDRTGYVNTPAGDEDTAQSLAELVNADVPVQKIHVPEMKKVKDKKRSSPH